MTAPLLASFDDVRYADLRRVQAAAAGHDVDVVVPSDAWMAEVTGTAPKFAEAERLYLAEAVRWVDRARVARGPDEALGMGAAADAVESGRWDGARDPDVGSLDEPTPTPEPEPELARPIAFATGCFDWLHSGHVRFFEEAASLGFLVVTVGNDASVRAFKGPRHPRFPAETRRYMVGAIRHVGSCLVATGSGWLDAESEMARMRPDVFVVNEDGDREEKRALCDRLGIEYRVLRRVPRRGLPRRSSTDLRGY